MRILAIETSCDDTGVAILEILGDKKSPSFKVLANVIASQIQVHQQYSGVHPGLAKREHQNNLVPTLIEALKESNLLKIKNGESVNFTVAKNADINEILQRDQELKNQLIPFLEKYEKPDINLISVTNGPGLEPCLWVGVTFAKALSAFWNIPVVPTNHIESHILVNLLENPNIKFPAIALIVSGGHTQIILVNLSTGRQKKFSYKILGETKDDAAGECFDKCAKLLGLGYPGGPAIAAEAAKFQISNFKFQIKLPRPMMHTKDYDFSFSGLKTAVLYALQKQNKKHLPASLREALQAGMAAEVQQAIVDVLIKKTIKAVKDFKAKSLILGGGVTANTELRKQISLKIQNSESKIQLLIPKPSLSTDNGLMVAVTGFYHQKERVNPSTSSERFSRKIQADGNLRVS